MKRIRQALAAAVLGAAISSTVAVCALSTGPVAAPATVQPHAPAAVVAPAAATKPATVPAPAGQHIDSVPSSTTTEPKRHAPTASTRTHPTARPSRPVAARHPSSASDTSYRCTNQIDYTGDPRDNATINSIGAETGHCPAPIR